MDADPVVLIVPTTSLAAEFQAMVEEFRRAGEASYQHYRDQIRADFPAYVRWIESLRAANPARPDLAPESMFWLVRDGHTVLGGSRLRYGLTARTAQIGGLARVLITCDTANSASARIIEKNGGLLENRISDPDSGEEVSRYWIAL
jgi:predicted acetyltransferase